MNGSLQSSAPPDRSRRLLPWVALSLGGAVALAFVWSLHAAMPENVLRLPASGVQWRIFWPQGWAFFTRDARSHNVHVYHQVDGAWVVDDIGRNADARWLFGWRRGPRARLLEAGFLGSFVQADIEPCDEEPGICLARAEPISLKNPTEDPLLCGPVGLVHQKPLPWAWLDGADETVMPSRVVALDVSCP